MRMKDIENVERNLSEINKREKEITETGIEHEKDKLEYDRLLKAMEECGLSPGDTKAAYDELSEKSAGHLEAYIDKVAKTKDRIISDKKRAIADLARIRDSLKKTAEITKKAQFSTATGDASGATESLEKSAERTDVIIAKETESLRRFEAEYSAEKKTMQVPDWDRTMLTPAEEAIVAELDRSEGGGDLHPTEVPEPDLPSHHLPSENTGVFMNEIGNSKFRPFSYEVREIMRQFGRETVEYKNGEPDFSPFAIHNSEWGIIDCTVEIPHMTQYRLNPGWDYGDRRPRGTSHDHLYYLGNYAQADIALAEKLSDKGVTWQDIVRFREERGLTWHECSDGVTMQLIHEKIHSKIPHSGGVAQKKYADRMVEWDDNNN